MESRAMRLIEEKTFLALLVIGSCCQHVRCENITNSSKITKQKILPSISPNQLSTEDDKMTYSDKTVIERPPPSPLNTCDSKICPEGLVHYRSQNRDFCYTVLKRNPFPPKCPYPLFLSVTDPIVENIYKLFQRRTIWIMAKRNVEDGFDPFEWISNDQNKGWPVDFYANTSVDIAEKNCLIAWNLKFRPVKCQEKHTALCIYPYDSSSISKYCRKHYLKSDKYLTCIADSIDIEDNSCYCETARKASPDSFCDTLAEPLLPHQSDLLIHKLDTVHDVCWIGLYVNESGIPRWINSKRSVDYSCWSSDVDHSKPFGAIKFVNDNGWLLADDDGTIQCGICELKNVYDKNVSIQLKYNPSSSAIQLRVRNPFELSDYFGKHYILFCFAGPTLNTFKHRVSDFFYNFYDNPQSSPEVWVGHIANDWNFPIYYWCEGFQHPNLKPVYSNTILVHNNIGGYEYSMRVKACTSKDQDPYLNNTHLRVRDYILEMMWLTYNHQLRAMKVLNYNQEKSQIEMILHLTTGGTQNELLEYNSLQVLMHKLFENNSFILNITHFRRSDVCLPSTTTSNKKKLMWPKTITGAITLPLEICLQENGNPVMRKCKGNFLHGGFWSGVIGICTDEELPERSKRLNQLLYEENITAKELSATLCCITCDNHDVTVVDVYLISKLLERLDTFEDVNITDVVTIISNIMNFEPNILRKAQELLNCTDNILYSFDNILGKIGVDEGNEYNAYATNRVLVQVADVRTTNIIGIALKGNSSGDFESFTLIPLYKNISMEELLDDTIELAAFLPSQLIEEIENCTSPVLPIKFLMAVFCSDVLFNENPEETRQPNSRIINILIPDFFCSFSTPIPVIFNPIYAVGFEKKCAFWKYGRDNYMGNSVPGFWEGDGKPKVGSKENKTYAVCAFDHVTHFALLMMGSFTKEIISKENALALDIITAFGTTLSLGSILAMFVIGIFVKTWRQRTSNKILLNFSVAIALQMILLYVANNVHQDGVWCVITGAALHYTVLSEFLWMLIIAFLQYRKFVTVFHQQVPNLVAKACTICWGLPLMPIVILLAISTDSYAENINGLCYPLDKYFYFAVVLPVSIIVLINFTIFVKIIFAICQGKIQAYGSKNRDRRLQVLLALFLFFLLGISWIFGLALGFGAGIVFSYLFCLTATFQGLVMFLFFVVMNENSKRVWMHVKRTLHLKPQGRRTSSSSYSQSQITEVVDRRGF